MKNMKQTAQKGFTLIELMIVIAIVGILSAVALPAYQTYTKKARFTEVVLAAQSVRSAIDICFQTRGETSLSNCDTEAKAGADTTGAAAGAYVDKVEITATTALITATGTETTGSGASAAGITYTLEPSPSADGGSLTWKQGGTCIAEGLC
jgi:type IV pilus assembly protein PilA